MPTSSDFRAKAPLGQLPPDGDPHFTAAERLQVGGRNCSACAW